MMVETTSGNQIYRKQPIRMTVSGIPVFSGSSEYIENYHQTSSTRLKSLEENGVHPWMSETT